MLLKASEMTSATPMIQANPNTPAADAGAPKANPLSALAGLKRPGEIVKPKPAQPVTTIATAVEPAAPEPPPMMKQWAAIKAQTPDVILFFRVGDFYELFHQDAETAARVLGLTLTTRGKDSPSPVPMAGFPYHQLDAYLRRLVQAGFRAAVCDPVDGGEVNRPGRDNRRDTLGRYEPTTVVESPRPRFLHCQKYEDRKRHLHPDAVILCLIEGVYEAHYEDAHWMSETFGLPHDAGEPTVVVQAHERDMYVTEIVRRGRRVAIFNAVDEVESSSIYSPETEANTVPPFLSTDKPAETAVPSRPSPGPIETLAKSNDPLHLIAAAYHKTMMAKAAAKSAVKEYERAVKALDDLMQGVAIAWHQPAEEDVDAAAEAVEAAAVAESAAVIEQAQPPAVETTAAGDTPRTFTFTPQALALPLNNVMVGDIGLPPGISSTLKSAGILTVENLTERLKQDGSFTKIPRIGKAKADTIEETLHDFFRQRGEREQTE